MYSNGKKPMFNAYTYAEESIYKLKGIVCYIYDTTYIFWKHSKTFLFG